MRTMMIVRLPHEPFNAALRDGTADAKMERIMDAIKPEAVYYAALDGKRTPILIVEMADPSQIPVLAEPWFMTFGADVEFHPVMTQEDLEKAGLAALGKKWA